MLGCDVVEISRFFELKDSNSFLKKYFTENEISYISSKSKKEETMAGIFACKEAVLKAFTLGIGGGLDLIDIEILHNENGVPYINTNLNKIKDFMLKNNYKKIDVGISHSNIEAFAVALLV